MADIIEVFFILQFISVIGIIVAKLINIMSVGRFYQLDYDNRGKEKSNLNMPFILFFLYYLNYGIGLICFLSSPTIFISMLFQLETWFIGINLLFLFIEILYYYKLQITGTARQKRNSMQEYKGL